MNIVIPIAGSGQRFVKAGYTTIKPLIEIEGEPMAIKSIRSLGFPMANFIFIIRNFENYEKLEADLKFKFPRSKILILDQITDGPARTVLAAKEYINNGEQLIVANCDQIMWWPLLMFDIFCESIPYAGAVVTFEGGDKRHSFTRLNRYGFCADFAEKKQISSTALVGIHYWKKGRFFVESAEEMISLDDRAENGEFYVAPTYNYLVRKGYTVVPYHIPKFMFNSVGTPEELIQYLEKNENEKI